MCKPSISPAYLIYVRCLTRRCSAKRRRNTDAAASCDEEPQCAHRAILARQAWCHAVQLPYRICVTISLQRFDTPCAPGNDLMPRARVRKQHTIRDSRLRSKLAWPCKCVRLLRCSARGLERLSSALQRKCCSACATARLWCDVARS